MVRPLTHSWRKFIFNTSIHFNLYAWVMLIAINYCKEIAPKQLMVQMGDKVLLL